MPTENSTNMNEFDPIFDLMKDGKTEESIEYVKQGKLVSIDCGDINGTTPLQYVNLVNNIYIAV